jgi:hypothetical protein
MSWVEDKSGDDDIAIFGSILWLNDLEARSLSCLKRMNSQDDSFCPAPT